MTDNWRRTYTVLLLTGAALWIWDGLHNRSLVTGNQSADVAIGIGLVVWWWIWDTKDRAEK
jgi:hypothetical protein